MDGDLALKRMLTFASVLHTVWRGLVAREWRGCFLGTFVLGWEDLCPLTIIIDIDRLH